MHGQGVDPFQLPSALVGEGLEDSHLTTEYLDLLVHGRSAR
jgi:hypothetical protein